MNKTLEALKARNFLKQCTDIEALSKLMDQRPITFYVGADPTGSSLHIGHMVPMFALRHFTTMGHKPIILIGGGTGRIGDPSGKTEMRKILDYEQINQNAQKIKEQLTRFIGPEYADIREVSFANNAEWLENLNFIDFMRDIGSQFSVNRMLTYEAYKKRMETGLSFLEFTYQLLQSYDFLQLHTKYGCDLQIGGDDQWGNIVAGVDLIRRKTGDEVFGLTFPLIVRADGKKMGKSEKGAIFLDPELTSPYEFFQYFRNVDDRDVEKFFLLFTFLPEADIAKLCSSNINEAKTQLAYEVTRLVHGEKEAENAKLAAHEAFYGSGAGSAMPSIEIAKSTLPAEILATDVFVLAKLCSSKSEARRLIEQGGAFINNEKLTDVKKAFSPSDLDEAIVRAGKKHLVKIKLS